jgi:hypothetical protein
MKQPVYSLIVRNAIVGGGGLLLMIGYRFVPRGYLPPWLLIPFAFFCAVLWANSILIRRGRPVLGVVLSLFLVPVLGIPAVIVSIPYSRSLIEWQYLAQGFELVHGCNGGAANGAEFDVYKLQERLADLTGTPRAGKNEIAQLQEALALAQEKARVLNDDCGRRGHCDTKPWRASWSRIRQVIDASEEVARNSGPTALNVKE